MMSCLAKMCSRVLQCKRVVGIRMFLLLLVTTVLFILVTMNQTLHSVIFLRREEDSATKSHLLVDTASCRIPDIDPFDESIKRFASARREVNCNGKSLTYQDGDFLRTDRSLLSLYFNNDFDFCEYEGIRRPEDGNDDKFVFTEKRIKFTQSVQVKEEFVRVRCLNKAGNVVFKNYYAFAVPKPELEKELKSRLSHHRDVNKPREILNVMMIGIDSVSRLNHVRHMLKTRDYLLRNLSAIELQGYTKVADNTFVNIVPMTTGKFVEELPWTENQAGEPFDKYDFIWKNFSQNGYATLYAEDASYMSIFNYLKRGFKTPPADYYNRPISLAVEADASLWSKDHNCVHNRMETEIILNYTTDFASVIKSRPRFSFSFISRLTHESLALTFAADAPYSQALRHLHDDGLLNDTVLLLFGDHGIRYGQFRETYIGRLEERLPMMHLVFPPWFYKKYPDITKNLKINQNRLTTPFDIYETLKDILYFSGKPRGHVDVKKQRGISLFEEIPRNRTCDHAGILLHWCVCMDSTNLSPDNKIYNSSIKYLVSEINNRIRGSESKCAKLSVHAVRSVKISQNNEKVLTFVRSENDVINRKVSYSNRAKSKAILQLAVTLSPGGGQFEATMIYDEQADNFKMAGDVSRVNKYGHDGDCVQEATLRKYCYCH